MCAHAHAGHTQPVIKHCADCSNFNDITINQRQQRLDTKELRNAQRFIPANRYSAYKDPEYLAPNCVLKNND